MISDLDAGIIENVNDSFVELTGHSFEEAVGKSSVELGLISLDDRERLKQKLLNENRLRNLEVKFFAKDRSTLYGLFNGEVIECAGVKKRNKICSSCTARPLDGLAESLAFS